MSLRLEHVTRELPDFDGEPVDQLIPVAALGELGDLTADDIIHGDNADHASEMDTAAGQPSDSSDTYVAAARRQDGRHGRFRCLASTSRGPGHPDGVRPRPGLRGPFSRRRFFGRFLGEIAYSLNDALSRLEGNTSYYVMSGDGDTLQNYYLGLEGRLAAVGRDLDGIIVCCKRKVG